jgi:hypothetical protein
MVVPAPMARTAVAMTKLMPLLVERSNGWQLRVTLETVMTSLMSLTLDPKIAIHASVLMDGKRRDVK